jgi:glycosyltransferase involved in cell wall biosynthesis
MNFSIIIPTRKRPESLSRLLNSIKEKTHDLSDVEIIIYKDTDDIVELPEGLNANILTRKRSDKLIKDYINQMALMSEGKYVWFLGDDCEIVTDQWDVLAKKIIEESKMDKFFGDTKDNTRNFNNVGQFACFPIISRKSIDALGYFFHPEIAAWGGDKYCHYVYSQANKVLDMQKIELIHHHVRNDDTAAKVEEAYNKYGSGDKIDYSSDIERIG